MTHIPAVVPAEKMDTPVGLWRGTCSCGWQQVGAESERYARVAAEQHAVAKNTNLTHERRSATNGQIR